MDNGYIFMFILAVFASFGFVLGAFASLNLFNRVAKADRKHHLKLKHKRERKMEKKRAELEEEARAKQEEEEEKEEKVNLLKAKLSRPKPSWQDFNCESDGKDVKTHISRLRKKEDKAYQYAKRKHGG